MTNAELKMVETLMEATIRPTIDSLKKRIEELEKENSYLKEQNSILIEKI